LLDGLNPAQREAVQHIEGPLLILAGPGSGKTRVVTHRIAYLIDQGVPGHQILALTFTNKAAEEMRARVAQLVPGQEIWVGTYHRFCARLLRKYASMAGIHENYTIYDADDSARALRQVLGRLGLLDSHFTPEAVAAAISWAKNRLIGPDEYTPRVGHPLSAVICRAYPAYQAHLAQSNAADFDDLLLHVGRLLRGNPELRQSLDDRYRFVLVDEYQDTNLAQYAIARALSIDYPNLAVTGDPDQSIYGWRGADLNNILEFEKDYPSVKVVRLEQNYRSTKRILRVASHLIAHNVRRKPKDLHTENAEGAPVRLVRYATHKDEAQGIAARIAEEVRAGRRRPRDFAVFYRVNALSRTVEIALREQGVPYQVVHGVEFFQRKEIKDVLAYLRLVNNPSDDVAFQRVLNEPPRGIGKITVDRLVDYAAARGLPLLEAARQCQQIASLDARATKRLSKFVALCDRLIAASGTPIRQIVGMVLDESGYRAQFEQSEHEEDQQRLANIEELLTVAREFDERNHGPRPLEEFLEETSLTGDTDDWQRETDRVTLMTLHASKGLEFPVVFLMAVEQGLLPHERSRNNPAQIEEERRLMFVGITRAQEELQISYAAYRDFRGQKSPTIPSPFLMELPLAEMERHEQQMPLRPESMDPAYQGEPGHEEPVFRVEPSHTEEEHARGTLPAASASRSAGIRLMTAAELLHQGEGWADSPSPDDFYQGMLVRHPEKGLGTVVALQGQGPKREAIVEFRSPAQRVQFVIAQSPLRPVR
jgi:DNA helicase-2/ATP-dependent DNA helicase PcrA